MSLIWGLAFPLPTHLSLMLLGFLVYGIWTLFSWYQSQTKVAAKTEASKKRNRSLKQIRKLTVSQLEETEMNVSAADLTRISGLPTDWTQEYVLWSIDRSLRQIFQHLDNARSALMELNVSDSQDVTSSSVSDIGVQEAIPPSCHCKKGKPSTDYSMSSASSNNSSSMSFLPMFPEGTAWQLQSDSVPVSPQKEPFMPRSPGTSLPTSQLTDPEKSDLSPNLAVLPPLQAQTSFISSLLESLDPCKQEKTKDKGKTHFQSNHGSDSDLDESPGPLVWAPLQLSPLIRGELEGHRSQKVSTLQQEVVPLPVKKSWNILNHLMDVQGVPEEELPKTQLPTVMPLSAEQNTNTSPDPPSFHLHMNIGVNSGVHRTEAIVSQPFPSNRQSQPQDDRQELRYNPLVISTGMPSPRNLGVNIIQEEQALVKKDSKHVLEPNIEPRVIGLPEKRVQTNKAQLTNVELTPKIPCSATDNRMVTPLALLQVMDLMGIIPESQSELIDSVGFSPQPPNQAETVSITLQPSTQVIGPIKVTHHQHQTTELKSKASRLSQVTDDMKVTPVALFQVTGSMGMIDKFSPHGIEPVGIAPKSQYQVMDSVKTDTTHNYHAIRPGSMSRGPQQTVVEAVEMIPQPQHKDMGTLTMTLGSQNQATKHIRITPRPVHQNAGEISSSALPEAIDDTKVSPVAKQAMDVMQIFPLGQPHITKSPAENLTPVSVQPDVPTTTVSVGTVESRSVPPQPPSKVLEPSGMTDDLLPSGQSLHALKVTSLVQASPTGMITPLQIVEAHVKESLELTSGLQGQVGDSVGTTPPSRGTECVSLTPKSHEIMEPTGTIPEPPDQGAVPIGRSQKHQVPGAEVVPVIPLLQEMEYLGGSTIPQPKVRDSMDLPPVPLLEDTKTPLGEGRDLIPEALMESMEVGELIPSTHFIATKPLEVTPKPSYHFLEPEGLTLQHPASEARVTSEPCRQVEESALLPQSSLGMTPAPLSQTSESVEMSSPPLQDTLESETQVVKEMEETPESGSAIKDTLDLLLDSEVQTMSSGVMAPEPQPPDVKFVQVTLEPCAEVTNPLERTLKPEYEDTETFRSTFSKVDDTQGTIVDLYSEVRSLEFSLEPGVQGEKSESFAQNLNSAEVITEPPVQDVEPTGLTTGPKPHVKDVIPRPQLHEVKSRQMDRESQLQNENPVNVIQSSSAGDVDPEKTKPEPRLSVKSQLIPGTKLQKVQLGKIISMLSTPGIQAGDKEHEELSPGSTLKGLKPELPPSEPQLEDRKSAVLTLGQCLERIKSTVISPSSSQSDGMKSVKLIPGSRIQDLKAVGLVEPEKQGESPVTCVTGMLCQDKPIEVLQGLHQQNVKPKELTSRPQTQDSKRVIISCLKQQSLKPVDKAKTKGIQGVKFMDLVSTQQYQGRTPMDLTLEPGQDDHISSAEWKVGMIDRLNKQLESMESDQEPKPTGRKPIELTSKLQCKDTPSFELAPEPVVHNVKAQEVQYGPQVPSMEPCPLPPESQVYQVKALEPMSEPPLQEGRTVALNTEPQSASTKSVQWIPVSEFQREKCIGSNFRLQSQSASPTELKPSTQRRGVRSSELTVRSKIQGEKSGEFRLESQLQQVKTSPLALGLQKTKTLNLTSEPQTEGINTDQLNKETQVESVRSIQWIPRPEFHGVTLLRLNSGSPSPGVKSTERKPSIQLEGAKTSETALGTKPQGKKSVDFNPGPQVQCVKTPEWSPGPELQEGGNITSPSELQSQCVKSVALHQGPPLENTKSVLWTPLSDSQVNKSILNLRLPPQDVTAKESKPSVQLDVKTSDELTTRPKSQGKQPSGSTQEHQSQRSKSIGFNSEQQFRNTKTCDPTLRSKINNTKLTFKPRFCLEDRSSLGLNPGIQPQDVNPLGSSPGTQPPAVTPSVFKQESQSSEVKYGAISQRPQSQNNVELKCGKSSELALQTKPRGMKSENSSGPQWQRAKCSDLTPNIESPNMKCPKLSRSSQLKGKPCIELATGTKNRRVKLGCKPGPQWQGIKSNSFLRTEPQEMEMEDWESGPKLQDLKSSRTIMGIKVYDVMSVDAGPGPHFQGMTSEVIRGKRAHGMKSGEIKPSFKLQGKKHDFTPRKMLLGTTSMEFNSEQQLQDVMSSELGLGISPQSLDVNPGPQLQEVKPFEGLTETKLPDEPSPEFKHKSRLQGRASCDVSTEPQIDCKNVMASNTRTQNVELSESHPGPDLQGIKSKVFCLGQHLEDVNSACTPNANSQHIYSSGCKRGPYLEAINSSACIPEPDPQWTKSVCNPGPHLHGMSSSACILGPKLQCVDSTGCIHEPNWQDENSSVCTPGSSPQCMSSSVCTPGPTPQCVNSACKPGPSPQCVNSSVCTPGPSSQCVNNSVCSPGPSPRCVNSSACSPGPSPQCVNSACSPGPSPPCVNSTECHPEVHLQGVNQWASILGPYIQCVASTGRNPKSHYQGVNPSSRTPGQNPQCEHSKRCSLEPLLLGMSHGRTFPAPQIMCVNPVWCNTKTHLQDVDSSACTRRQELQAVNSTGYNPGPHLQARKLQGMKFSESNSGTGIQREMPIIVNQGRHVQDLKLESTPGSSHLMAGAKFQEIPFLKNQLGSWQDTAQPVFTLRPPSNGGKSVGVSPTPLPEDRMSPEMSKQPLLCLTNSVKVKPGCGLQDLRSKEFSPEPCFQKVKSVKLKPGSSSQSVNPLEFAPCHCSPESTRNFLAGPALSSVKFSNLIPESQQQCMKLTEFTSEPKWQSVNHVKLSSVSLSQTGTSVGLSPRPFLQNVTPGNQNPQTRDQIIESSQVIYRPGHQLEDYAEKMRHQVSKFMDSISLPVYQDAQGSSEMTKGLGHQSPETTEKSMKLTPKPTDQVIESLGMPQQLDLQGPESVDLTPTLSDADSKSSELTPQKSYWSPETLQLLPCLWPQFKDFKELPTEQDTGSDRMTLDLKNHVAEVRMLTCEVRPGKEFLSVTSKPVNRETGHVEKSPRLCPQDLGPVVVSFGKRSQREQSVASPPRPSHHVPDSASGITPGQGPQIPESVSLTSKSWLQIEESLELSTQQTSQVVEDTDCEELTFESWQPGEVASRLTKPQGASMGTLNITPIESLDQMINFIRISPKQLGQVTESAKTRHHVSQSAALPKVSESVEVIPGPPFQVIESVMIPEPTSQGSKHADLTPKLHDVIMSEFASSLWLQNVQSKKLISAPTHQILETIELSGFQVIKTILVPKPLLLIVKSEELAPGPNPQAIEPIGVATKSSIKVMDGLNLLPRPHLQDMVKPMERTPRANIQENFAELILQQTSPLEEPPVLTHEQRLQAEKSLGIRTESPKAMETEDLNQRRVCEDRDSEMITSEMLQAQNYFSRFIPSPSIPFISSSVKTTELGPLQGSGMPEVSRALAMKNFAVGILPSPESYTDTIMFRSSALPLVLPSDIGNTVGTLYPDIWEVDVLSKRATKKKQMEEFGNSFQSYSPYPLRLLPSEFQAGLGARRNSIRSFLGRQQNVWESHVCRQRLPRKYLSNMQMLGNVLGTTMERKLCSQPFLTEGATMDTCQFIQSLFGVPAELMAFSQSLVERGPRTISQTSVVKNYIQRRTLCHGHEKRMPLKMWTRGSTSSIIQQYSGTRLGLKKTDSKLSDIFQEVTQHVSVSCTRAQFPALMKPESSLQILYNREDPVSSDQSKASQSESPTRTFDSHHSLKASCLSQAKRDISEQLHLLKDLQLKIAAKLLESQVPHNVPPPFSSGLVLKYPICLQCGRCLGGNCCHKLQSAFGPYLLVYPQIHLLSTREGHGEIRLLLGFRLRTGKRPQVSKHRGRKRADTWKSTTSPSRRKAKIYPPASKSPTTPRDFQSRSSRAPASVQVHIRKKQWGSHGVVGKTDTKESEHHEFCQVHSVSKSGFESNQEEKWSKSSLKKTFDLKYPKKETIEGLKTQNTKLYKNSETPKESPFRIMCPSRSKSIETVQTSTVSLKTQPKKSSQPKFIHRLFQGLRQAFQIVHRTVAYTGQKPEDRTRPGNLWSTQYLHPKQKAKEYCLPGDSQVASTPVAQQRSADVNPKQEDRLQGTGDQCRQTQQPNAVSSLQPIPLPLETMASERDATIQGTSVTSQRRHSSPSDRTLSRLSERSHCRPSHRQDSSPSVRTLQSLSDWSHYSLFKGRGRSPSGRSRPSPGRRPRSPSRRSLSPRERRGRERRGRERRGHSPSKRSHLSPIQRTRCGPSERSHGSLSERNPFSPSGRKRHNSSGRGHHLPSESRLYRSSSRLHRSHSERTHYSPSENRHRYSERSRQGHNEGPHHSTKERLRGKEKPRPAPIN